MVIFDYLFLFWPFLGIIEFNTPLFRPCRTIYFYFERSTRWLSDSHSKKSYFFKGPKLLSTLILKVGLINSNEFLFKKEALWSRNGDSLSTKNL